jgi:hypothetical protein
MSRELANIIKILFVTFFLIFEWENAIAEEEVTVLEEITVTEEDTEKKESEEEPDCE